MKLQKCIICGKEFDNYRAMTCSKECSDMNTKNKQIEYRKAHPKQTIKFCMICGKSFVAKGGSKTCSKECSEERKKQYTAKVSQSKKKERKVRKLKKMNLVQAEKKAREMGMSYGMYMAYLQRSVPNG